jgi:uncharacterized linocin/CFP29 family protein
MEFLKRNKTPLSESDWKKIDKVVVETAKRVLVGRRFIEISGRYNPSVQLVPYDYIEDGNFSTQN